MAHIPSLVSPQLSSIGNRLSRPTAFSSGQSPRPTMTTTTMAMRHGVTGSLQHLPQKPSSRQTQVFLVPGYSCQPTFPTWGGVGVRVQRRSLSSSEKPYFPRLCRGGLTPPEDSPLGEGSKLGSGMVQQLWKKERKPTVNDIPIMTCLETKMSQEA